jgi:hypothetical protein
MKINNPCVYVGNQALITKNYFVDQLNHVSGNIINQLSGQFTGSTSGSTAQFDEDLANALKRIIPSSILSGSTLAIQTENGEIVQFVTEQNFEQFRSEFTSMLSAYVTSDKLSAYVTSDKLTDYLKSYVTSDDISAQLANYVRTEDLSSAVSNAVSGAVSDAVRNVIVEEQLYWPTVAWSDVSGKIGDGTTSVYLSGKVSSGVSVGNVKYDSWEITVYPTTESLPVDYAYGPIESPLVNCALHGINGKVIACYTKANGNNWSLTYPDVTYVNNNPEGSKGDTSSINIHSLLPENYTGLNDILGSENPWKLFIMKHE